MKHFVLSPPGAPARTQSANAHPAPTPRPMRAWYRILWVAGGLAAAWWWMQDPTPATAPPATTAVRQAERTGQAWPFAAAPAVGQPATAITPSTSPWDRLSSTNAPAEDTPDTDPRSLNAAAAIAPSRLSMQRPLAAQAFLDHVVLLPEPRGGYAVQSVSPGSLYERAGLRPGDAIHTLDTPDQPPIDETNMVALTSVHTLAFDVVRDGALVRLSVALNEEEPIHGTH